jgi:hypothetical protein
MKKFLIITLVIVFSCFIGSGTSLAGKEGKSKEAQEQKKQELKEINWRGRIDLKTDLGKKN